MSAIAFLGDVVRVRTDGRTLVRLDNGHVLTVRPRAGDRAPASRAGARVRVELGSQDLMGWRLERRP